MNPFSRTIINGILDRGYSLPREYRLFYSRTPNNWLDVGWEGGFGWDSDLSSWSLPVSCYDAVSADTFWFSNSTTPVVRTGAEILAWAGTNNWNVLFTPTKGLAVYSLDAPLEIINKARRYFNSSTTPLPTIYPTLAWGLKSSAGLTSRYGPNPTFISAGATPDGIGGTYPANVLPVDKANNDVYVGPGYGNLLTPASTAPASLMLTAQKYCLQCFDIGSVSCSYGTATPGVPLIFTATAGTTTFTPTSCGEWMLTASGGYVFPRIAHGTTVTSCAGSVGGNGLSWLMDTGMLECLAGRRTTLTNLFKYSSKIATTAGQWELVNTSGLSTIVNGVVTLQGGDLIRRFNIPLKRSKRYIATFKPIITSGTNLVVSWYHDTTTYPGDGITQWLGNGILFCPTQTSGTITENTGVLLVANRTGNPPVVFEFPEILVADDVTPTNHGSIVMIGDSLTKDDIPVYLRRLLTTSTVIDAGIAGNTLSQMDSRFITDVVDINHSGGCVIIGGLNDGLADTSLDAMKESMLSIINKAKNANISPIIIGNITPFKLSANWTQAREDKSLAYNTWLGTIISADTQLKYCDLYSAVCGEDGAILPGLDGGDHIHFNHFGYEVIACMVQSFYTRELPPYIKTTDVPIYVGDNVPPSSGTVAALVRMGAGSAEIPNSTDIGTLSPTSNAWTLLSSKTAADGTASIVSSNDGTTQNTKNSAWAANEYHLKTVQTNKVGTQFRVGNYRIGIDTVIQWSAWSNYDGSFNPLTYLRAAFNGTIPMHIKSVQVWDRGEVPDATILDWGINRL